MLCWLVGVRVPGCSVRPGLVVPPYGVLLQCGVGHVCFAAQRRGSISAEHGIGVMKAAALGYSKSDAAVAVMRATKAMLDPHGILNPGKVLPK